MRVDKRLADIGIWTRGVVAIGVLILAAGCQSTPEHATVARPTVERQDPEILVFANQALKEGRYQVAGQLIQRALLSNPRDPEARLLLGELQLDTGQAKLAAESFKALTATEQVSARAHQGRGIALLHLGASYAALKELEAAVEKDASLWRSWNALGHYHDRNRHWQAAEECYARAMLINQDSAILYNNRGFSRILQSRFDDAIGDLTKALELDPSLTVARQNLRIAIAWKGDYKQATLGAEGKAKGQALNNVGYIALLRGDYEAAEAYFQRALDSDAAFNRTASRNLRYLASLRDVQDPSPAFIKTDKPTP